MWEPGRWFNDPRGSRPDGENCGADPATHGVSGEELGDRTGRQSGRLAESRGTELGRGDANAGAAAAAGTAADALGGAAGGFAFWRRCSSMRRASSPGRIARLGEAWASTPLDMAGGAVTGVAVGEPDEATVVAVFERRCSSTRRAISSLLRKRRGAVRSSAPRGTTGLALAGPKSGRR